MNKRHLKKIMLIACAVGLISVCIIGIPQYAAPRQVSVKKSIHNNLRVILACGEQALIESGCDKITFHEISRLNSFPDNFTVFDDEDYTAIVVHKGMTNIIVNSGNHGNVELKLSHF